jgi:anti-sigma factor RsiW
MNCAEFESVLADYLDGTLSGAARASVEEHISACGACREFMADVNGGLGLLRQSEPVAAPGELITRIAYLAPRGRSRDPFENPGLLNRFVNKWLRPALQPRLAMSMAMTILSFAMLERCTGVQVQRIRPADLSPVRVWSGVENKALRVRDQAVKYYENLRIVYEVESHLKDLQEAQNSAPPARTARTSSSNPNGSGSARPSKQGVKP